MFNGKKFVAVSGLLGGLAMTWIGAGQAYAMALPGVCGADAQGNIICTQRIVGETREGEDIALRRSVTCQPTKPVTLPAAGLLNHGTVKLGPEITCAQEAPEAPAVVSDNNTEPRLGQLGLPF
ncbi:hypothetical protein [Streptomyces sp. SD31]|uniref:hypothetical protein n=1 Tax=Streptomyces sp. SD31 TaxID=3452208 RepID=UPI003F8C0C66